MTRVCSSEYTHNMHPVTLQLRHDSITFIVKTGILNLSMNKNNLPRGFFLRKDVKLSNEENVTCIHTPSVS